MSLVKNLEKILNEIPGHVRLCAVSKTKPVEMIQELYQAGQLDFGENKVQEMTDKSTLLPSDIHWHQIGTLQRNKVKYLASYVHLIHSIDSLKLLKEVQKEAEKNERTIDVLLQMHIAEEETKFGLDRSELENLLTSPELANMTHIRIRGLMGMATFTQNTAQIAREFGELKKRYDELQSHYPDSSNIQIDTLSMGMSGDYTIAIDQGSNLIRVGSAIFGERIYN
ncbi:MAG: YggS family pyridoxal phosphate-dependent enzyme [Bacteroidetes bacterium]|nr:YggS family pyridoxal phosphate-dependent enzyme [Bacteroidota bacterium]